MNIRKLISGICVLAVAAVPFTAFADTTITQNSDPKSADAAVSTDILPTFTVTVPSDTTVAFNATATDFGSIELTQAQLEPKKVIKVTVNTAGKMVNSSDSTCVLPYTISGDDGIGELDVVDGTAMEFVQEGEKCDLTINITAEDWKAAKAGEYSDNVTFTIEYADVTVPEP